MSELGDSRRYFWTLTWIPGDVLKRNVSMAYNNCKDKELGIREMIFKMKMTQLRHVYLLLYYYSS